MGNTNNAYGVAIQRSGMIVCTNLSEWACTDCHLVDVYTCIFGGMIHNLPKCKIKSPHQIFRQYTMYMCIQYVMLWYYSPERERSP